MKKTVTNDLLYYTGTKEHPINFNGSDSLPDDMRMDYLRTYSELAKSWYNDPDFDTQAASKAETDKLVSSYSLPKTKIRQIIRLDKMKAFAKKENNEYDNLHLYCGASAKYGELLFDRSFRPGPAAKLELSEPLYEFTFSFDIYIPKEYQSTAKGDVACGSSGRIIELRCGTLDRVKLKLYASGEVRAFSGDKWSPKLVDLGQYSFDEYNHVEISVGDCTCIKFNDKLAENISGYITDPVDNIFFEGGMLTRSYWKIKNLILNDKSLSFTANTKKHSEERLGTVNLPYAIGTYENRDKELYLESTFEVGEHSKAYLTLETLDPCGMAWINGELAVNTDSFAETVTDITHLVKNGKNTIRILVKPRPPEVNYYWHRHNDCYNGWFCGEAYITLTDETHIKSLTVTTDSVSGKVTGKIGIALSNEFYGNVKFTAAMSYPIAGEEVLLGCSVIRGTETEFSFESAFTPWTTENPVLYNIRAELIDRSGKSVDDFADETGFRTIEQKNGAVYINGRKTLLTGALLMQFLPPYDEIPVNHNCPSTYQIAWQLAMLKNMNGNFIRLHMLGYGTNDRRYARLCDRIGIMTVWITRYIDTLESLVWDGPWIERELFTSQAKKVLNHPSIIMWEGSNEFHPRLLSAIDRMYDEFTDTILGFDKTRLICPCSHLYYGGGFYDSGCVYYNDDGTLDQDGNATSSGKGWKHPLVIRSAHPYTMLCGYGTSWEAMRNQNWKWQKELFESKEHSYMATEFAITALSNQDTPEAKANTYFESYERGCEPPYIGRVFERSEWRESQALQALCAFNAAKYLRLLGTDGMSWCCLSSGANNGAYMKPPIDFYGYRKMGFYALKSAYEPIFAAKEDINVAYGTEDLLTPAILCGGSDETVDVTVEIISKDGLVLSKLRYDNIRLESNQSKLLLPSFKPDFKEPGYYTVKCTVESSEQ